MNAQPERGPLADNIQIDDLNDIVTIYGVRVAGEVLRYFTQPTRAGEWFRVVNIHNGVSTIETRRDDTLTDLIDSRIEAATGARP